jgi:hypothetical protein
MEIWMGATLKERKKESGTDFVFEQMECDELEKCFFETHAEAVQLSIEYQAKKTKQT